MSAPVSDRPCASARSGRREKSCTSLLRDPAGVLSDRRRWPDHICYPVMVESCRRWAQENGLENAGEYPLPLPDGRRVLLALRVRRRRSTLDLFGLEGYKPQPVVVPEILPPGVRYEQIGYNPALENPEDYLWVGPMVYILSEHSEDASLSELAQSAQEWWRGMSHMVHRGRPRGSGGFESDEDFLRAVANANRTLREQGKKITQENVAKLLHYSTRWLQQRIPHGKTWNDLKRL